MQIKKCTAQDAPQLAGMNKRLIEDEKSSNPMSLPELEDRMRGFLDGDYTAFFFVEEETVVGYALVRHTSTPLYLRQFFIEREFRRRHYGREAFRLLMEYLRTDTVDLDVLPWNTAGRAFWKSCGLEEQYISMRFKR